MRRAENFKALYHKRVLMYSCRRRAQDYCIESTASNPYPPSQFSIPGMRSLRAVWRLIEPVIFFGFLFTVSCLFLHSAFRCTIHTASRTNFVWHPSKIKYNIFLIQSTTIPEQYSAYFSLKKLRAKRKQYNRK